MLTGKDERAVAYGADLALSVGQILSIPLLILGIAFLARALRTAPFGTH